MLLHGVYGWLRSPWTPAAAGALVGLLLLQQSVMALRAVVKLGLWGAEVGAFGVLNRPRWCRAKLRRARARTAEAAEPAGAVVEDGAGI